MFELLKYVLPFTVLGMTFAEGDGSGGDNDGGAGDKGSEGKDDVVSKADHDKVVSDFNQLRDDYQDLRLEVMSPNYLEYLDQRGGKGQDDKKPPEPTDDQYENMSKKDLFEKAKKAAIEEMGGKISSLEEQRKKDRDEAMAKEVGAFARTHTDYEKYRPVMYGLSTDKKNANKSLQELYDMAKDHVQGIHAEPSAEEKARQKRLASEKPGGSNDSYDRLKKLSPDEAAREALKETKEKLGIENFPSV